jgi:LPS sulfotransferase NodH
MTKQTCYLVLATPRSGSTLLGQGLQASGLAGDPKEFFGHKMPFWMERWQTPTLPAFAAHLRQARATPNGVFGAKLLYRQLLHLESLARQDPELADLPLPEILDRLFPDLRFVWVTREDKVRQAISWFKARQTGVWGQSQERGAPKLGRAWRLGDEPLQPGEFAFDFEGIATLVRQAEAGDRAVPRRLRGVQPSLRGDRLRAAALAGCHPSARSHPSRPAHGQARRRPHRRLGRPLPRAPIRGHTRLIDYAAAGRGRCITVSSAGRNPIWL